MARTAVYGLILFVTFTHADKICNPVNLHVPVTQGKMLPGSLIATLTTSGRIPCAQSCLGKRKCKSVNFKATSGECQLNNRTVGSSTAELVSDPDFVAFDISNWPDVIEGTCAHNTCPLNSYCEPTKETRYECTVTGCLGSPTIIDGYFSNVPEESPFGSVLSFTCDPGYLPQGEVVCQNDGTWSSPVCVSVSSCSMVKQYQPDSEDGEYWLRLPNYDNYTTKIYCHSMSSLSPTEYLTLPNSNYGIYPRVVNGHCTEDSYELFGTCAGQGGEITYTKIRVDLIAMKVVKNDRQFASISGNGDHLVYGQAYDCYTPHENNALRCGTKGRFTIDLRGTGWRVRKEQTWEVIMGYRPTIESVDRQINGTLINLRCGGYPGGCRPTGDLFLTPLFL